MNLFKPVAVRGTMNDNGIGGTEEITEVDDGVIMVNTIGAEMTTAVANATVTIEEFLAIEDPDHLLELIDGKVVEMSRPKGRHGIVCAQFTWLLMSYVKASELGWVASNDTGVIIRGQRDSLRGVDVGFWSKEANPHEPVGYFETAPDLAVEILSPTDRRKDVLDKIKQYVSAGVRLVWLADPDAETVTVYRGTMNGVEHHAADHLDGGDVLPGFSRPVADFF
jgi:Uma2 family endonuclease